MKKQLSHLPQKPGVYLFRDQKNRVIYVGKAKNLKKRVFTYFHLSNLPADKKIMLQRIRRIEHIVVDTEIEALMLEHNLIKKYKPRYNVVLKDDKSYAYITISKEDFPYLAIIREKTLNALNLNKNVEVFGPYMSGDAAQKTLKVLRKIFPYRSCKTLPQKVCLYYHLNLCSGICAQRISKQDYQEVIREIESFLRGHHQEIIQRTKQKMRQASQRKQYEQAALYRNRLLAFSKVQAQQKIISPRKTSQDVISLARNLDKAAINLFIIREGRLTGKKNFLLIQTRQKSDAEILERFVKEYYLENLNRPQEIILPVKIPVPFPKIRFTTPQKGKKKKMLAMGQINAQQYLKKSLKISPAPKTKALDALAELTSYLKLQKIPVRIEAYDISNLQGQQASGAMIVFCNGQPDKSAYRRFKIKTIKKANDVGMMREILHRRFQKKEWPLPDLIIMDGGKPQLNIAHKTLKEFQLRIPVRALAKKLEEIYFPNQKKPITLPKPAQGLMLLKRIRDEAHRFAISYHRHLHTKQSLRSALDQISGIGPQRKKILLRNFGAIKKIQKASFKQLSKILGPKTAQKVSRALK